MRKRIIAGLAALAAASPFAAGVTATSAHAATVAQWDAVARCESSGRWNLPYGDDSSTGGLQIQDGTWRDYGGLAYGSRAYLATKTQQIIVAERILAGQGPRAWTTISNGCAGPTATLSNMHPGSYPIPVPPPVIKAAPHPTTIPNLTILAAPGTTYVVKSGDTLTSIAAAHHVSVLNLFRANKDTLDGDRDGSIDPGEDQILVGQQLRIPSPSVPPKANLPAPSLTVVLADGTVVSDVPSGHPAPVGATTHTVMSGDTLSQIAIDHRTTVAELAKLNGIVNPNVIHVGMVLKIPGNSGAPSANRAVVTGNTYVVKLGDCLSTIALRHGMSHWGPLWQANRAHVPNPNLIFPGQVLVLP